MSAILNQVLQANREYSNNFDKGDLPMPPGRQFAHFNLYGCPP